ncbi:MAG TPA: hypothetical protein VF997_11480 [Polyangia bacterium]
MGECFAAHRMLWESAAALSRRLSTTTDEGHLLHLGASCMRLAAEQALQARNHWEAMRGWRDCTLADRQIKLAIYYGLRRGTVDNGTYDDLFRLSRDVARLREEERQRLRREFNQRSIV